MNQRYLSAVGAAGCALLAYGGGGLKFTDDVRKKAADYPVVFPYLATPVPGSR